MFYVRWEPLEGCDGGETGIDRCIEKITLSVLRRELVEAVVEKGESERKCQSLSCVGPSLGKAMDCSSSVHGTSQARTLEWVAVPFSMGFSRPGKR